jgi:hypothetical protein
MRGGRAHQVKGKGTPSKGGTFFKVKEASKGRGALSKRGANPKENYQVQA